MVRYSREELEALRSDAADLPAGVDVSGMSMMDKASVGDGGARSSKRRRCKTASRARARKRRRQGADTDSDEDGDFGGMFDDQVNDAVAALLHHDDDDEAQAAAEDDYYQADDGDDESDIDDGPMQKVAFVVEGEPDFDKEEPDDGWEYVRRVKWEAARYPGVKVAAISPQRCIDRRTHYVPTVPAISACDPQLLPTQDWETNFLLTFATLRSRFQCRGHAAADSNRPVPHMKDECGWKALCFGGKEREATAGDGIPLAQELEAFGTGPLLFYRGELDILLNLDEVSRADLFQKHVKWLHGLDYLPQERAVWLLALTAALDQPVDAETSFALRTLLRSCAAIRASKKFRDGGELQILNMIIAIAGKYFGQDDSHCL